MSQTTIFTLGIIAIVLIICTTMIKLFKINKQNHPSSTSSFPFPFDSDKTEDSHTIQEPEPIDLSDAEINPNAPEIYNLLILDRSGSMGFLRHAARMGYNQTLNTIREAQKKYPNQQQHFASLVLFNDDVNTFIESLVSTSLNLWRL